MKILITGATGQLGTDCCMVLRKQYDVVEMPEEDLDITKEEAVIDALRKHSPDVVLNCAAFTNVDGCETMRELAWNVNVNGPKNLARCSRQVNARLIHISTDYVFSGSREVPEPYREDDEPDPLSWYGKTKLEGEEAVRRENDRNVIVRTAWVYGLNGHNFLKTILKLALNSAGQERKVVNDQFGSITWSYRLAKQIAVLIEANALGVFHATAEGYGSWFDVASYFLEKMNVPCHLVPCTTDEFPRPARRPANSILENRRLKQAGLNIMVDWRKDLALYAETHRERLIREALAETS